MNDLHSTLHHPVTKKVLLVAALGVLNLFNFGCAKGLAPSPEEAESEGDVSNNGAEITYAITLVAGNPITTEAGGSFSLVAKLTAAPAANVMVALASSNLQEGIVSPQVVTFTSGNWQVYQSVLVSGVDDQVADGNQNYLISFSLATEDAHYQTITIPDITVTNIDNDTSGLSVSSISGPTTEYGNSATFTVRLNSRPTGNVTIAVASNNLDEGTVSPASLTFTTNNWSSNQSVTVVGVDDVLADGNKTFGITLTLTSGDGNYANFAAPTVTVVNYDDDTAGINRSALSASTTTESVGAGQSAWFTVVLAKAPSGGNSVVISVTSSDTTEGSVSPSNLTFTSGNWSSAKTVTIMGVDDDVADGNISYALSFSVTSGDSAYNNFSLSNITLTNTDNDTRGVTLGALSGATSESAGSATFTVALNSEPTASVTLSLTSSNTAEGTVTSTNPLVFTTGNWNVNKTVTVTGVDDFVMDGNIAYTLNFSATSGDSNYHSFSVPPVTVTNNDNDAASFTVNSISGNTSEGGGTATFSLKLNSQPASNVVISVVSNNTSEGTVAPAILTFTSGNWSTLKTVTVTGVNDFVADGSIQYTISLTIDPTSDLGYRTLSLANVTVINTDNDTNGFSVSAISGNTNESGTTATFSLYLTAQPSADVLINVSSNDTSEGTVAPTVLTFTSGNWSTAKTATVTGIDDLIADGNVNFTVGLSVDASSAVEYRDLTLASLSVTNEDNEASDWAQQAYIKASNGDMYDMYGLSSVSLSGDTLAVGAYNEDSNVNTITNGSTASSDNSGTNSGAVYLYKRTGSTWEQQAYIKAINGNNEDQFGKQVSLSGETLAVAAPNEDSNQSTITNGATASTDNTVSDSGAVYIYQRTGNTWEQQAYIKAINNRSSGYLGTSLSLSGDTLAVGARLEPSGQSTITNGNTASNDISVPGSGAVYIYQRNESTWEQQAYIKAINRGSSDNFGVYSSLSGDTLAVVATLEDSNQSTITNGNYASTDNSVGDSGALYIYQRTNSTWDQQAYIKTINREISEYPDSVSLSGDTVALGIRLEDSNESTITHGNAASTDNSVTNSGAVFIYQRTGSTWAQQAYLKAINRDALDFFGSSVSISGDTLAVGAYREGSNQSTITNGTTASSNNSNTDSGAVYIYQRTDSTWEQQAYIKAINGDNNDKFGDTVSISGNTLAVGVYLERSNQRSITNGPTASSDNSSTSSGAAYIFKR